MMIETPTPCAEAITIETLSAWRDQALLVPEQQQIGAHITSCAACQTRIAALEAVGVALRHADAAQMQERVWRGLQGRLRRQGSGVRFRIAPGRASAIIAMVMLVALFGVIVHQRGAARLLPVTPTGTARLATPPSLSPTTTALPDVQLAWQTLPAYPGHNLVVAPGDGNTAYTCDQPDGASVVSVWATHDRGKSWQRMADAPSVQYGQCDIVVDDRDSAYVAVNILYNGHGHALFADFATPRGAGGPSEIMQYLSINGGQSWRPLGDNALYESATVGGVMYALVSVKQTTPVLGVSRDNGQTWKFVGQALNERMEYPAQMWIDPATREWLVEGVNPNQTKGDPTTTQDLWRSRDQGQTWTSFPTPALIINGRLGMAALPPHGGQPWLVCGETFDSGQTRMLCSADDGQSWQQIPAPRTAPSATDTSSGITDAPLNVLGIATNGAIIAGGITTIYRLAPGATVWQSLGEMPESTPVTFCPLPHGVFWQSGAQGLHVAALP